MRAAVKQLAVVTTAAVAVWSFGSGCDDSLGSDKAVRRAIVESRAAAAQGESGRADAMQKLEDAAGNAGASPAASAQAKAVLAAAQQAEAERLMRTIDANNREIARLVYEIGILGQQIASSNLKIDGYRRQEPTAAREDVAKKIAEVQGGADKAAWIAAENANIPTLAAVKQDVTRLQGEIDKKQDQIKGLEQQRVAAATEADKQRAASLAEKGQKSVDLFKAAADAQKKATDIATQIGVVEASIVPLQRDLAVAQTHLAATERAIDTYKKQLDALESGWKGTQEQVQTQAQIASSLVGAAGAGGPATGGSDGSAAAAAAAATINEKAELLAQKMQETDALFSEAEQRLDNAIKHYGDAAKAADDLARQANARRQNVPRNSPYYKAFDDLMLVVNPSVYKLGEAEANQMRATLYASRAINLLGLQRMVQKLQPILADAKLELPQQLNLPSLDTDVQRETERAAGTYDAAGQLYEQVKGAPQEITAKNTARIGQIFSHYGRVVLARATGNAEEAASQLKLAQDLRDAALDAKASLPAMPVELVVIPQAPSTAPTTAATTAPATAPAEGAAPAEPVQPAEGATTPDPAAPAPDATVEPPAPPADPAAPAAPPAP